MRYIYYNLIIILLVTAAFGLWIAAKPKNGDQDGVMTINSRVISQTEFTEREQNATYYGRSRQQYLDDLVSRELLIQEARHQGIDQEESFRHDIQEHYEQALIKQLIDRRRRELKLEVSDAELVDWQRAMGQQIKLRLVRYANPRPPDNGAPLGEEAIDTPFSDLPPALQLRILDLQPGDSTQPFPLDSGYGVIHVLERSGASPPEDMLTGAKLRSFLLQAREQIALEQWLIQLRNQASITISEQILPAGGSQ
jgi:SurA-like N-terminal domain